MSESSTTAADVSASANGKTAGVNWWKLPWLLLWLLPAASVVAGLSTVFIAVKHGDSMVKDDYYREGLAYNVQQQADQKAAGFRMHAMLLLLDQQSLDQRLMVIVSAEDLPALPETLELSLSHPTDHSADQRIVLRRQQGQQYLGDAKLTRHANWHVQLQPEDASWRLRGRWQSPTATKLSPEVL